MFKKISNYARFANRYISTFSQRWNVKHFETELALIQGEHENTCTSPSIIHFSFNRAATQYVKSILTRCAIENGVVPVSIHEYAFHTNFPFLDHLSAEEMEEYKHIFKKEGYIYSVFGGMVENIPHIESYKIVFVTRDPRDILVSRYYSHVFSHTIPDMKGERQDHFILKRAEANASTIDEYVITESNNLYNSYMRYKYLLLNKYDDIYITSYEKMVTEFDQWLYSLIKYCEFRLSQKFIDSLIVGHERRKPKKENIHNHTRKGLPGDYMKKLKPETITYLNNKFDFYLHGSFKKL